MSLLLSLLSLIFYYAVRVRAGAALDISPLLEFDPPFLVMDSHTETISIRMKKQPSKHADATVHLDFPGNLNFDKCSLTFTSENYAEFQTVTLTSGPSFGADSVDTVEIAVTLCAPDTEYATENQVKNYRVTPKLFKGGICSSVGDPHLLPFSGKAERYDVQNVGDYYLFNSELLSIQTRTSRLDETVRQIAWNERVAVRYGTSACVILHKDGKLRAENLMDVNPEEIEILFTNDDEKSMDLTLGDGSKISLAFTRGIDVTIVLAPGKYADATGLCFKPAGQTETLAASENTVPDTDNMFLSNCKIPHGISSLKQCKKNCNSPTPECPIFALQLPITELDVAPAQEQPPHGCTRVTDLELYDASTPSIPPQINANVSPISEEEAEAACIDVLASLAQTPETMELLDFQIASCVADYGATGDLGVLEASKQTYNAGCRQILDSETHSNVESVRDAAENTKKVYGIGDVECPGGCSGNGVCRINGCSCDYGWMGAQCMNRVEDIGKDGYTYKESKLTSSYAKQQATTEEELDGSEDLEANYDNKDSHQEFEKVVEFTSSDARMNTASVLFKIIGILAF